MKLTLEQKYKICRYLLNKYCPMAEDGLVHESWKACEHCPFGPKGCKDNLNVVKLSDELKEVIM